MIRPSHSLAPGTAVTMPNELLPEAVATRRDLERRLQDLQGLPPLSPERETVGPVLAELRLIHGSLSGGREVTRDLLDAGRRTIRTADAVLGRVRAPTEVPHTGNDPGAPGAAVLDERDTHVVCDALAEVRVRYLKQPDRPLWRVAAEVYEQHVEGRETYREFLTLEAAGEESIALEGVPDELAERYERDPQATGAVLGFISLVRETYGYSADA